LTFETNSKNKFPTMKGRSHSVFIWMAAIAMVSFTISSDQQKVKEYLSVPGPLQFNGMAFQLN